MKQQFEQNFKITVTFYDEFTMPFDVTPQDTLVEIRQYLTESSLLYFYNNFHFDKNGKRVNEYLDIGSNEIQDGDMIKVVLGILQKKIIIVSDEFDERSARYHVKKIQEGTQNIGLLQFILQDKSKQQGNDDFPFNSKVSKTLFYEQTKNETQGKQQEIQLQLNDVLRPEINQQYLFETTQVSPHEQRLLSNINFSGYNPPLNYRKYKGDFFYLIVQTLESAEFHITANPIGFFVNKSTSSVFDPEINTHFRQQSSLMELLKDLSLSFSNALNACYESKEINQFPVQLISQMKFNQKWLTKEQPNEQTWNNSKMEQWALNLYGLDITTVRDWNEELQVFRNLPKTDFIQKINRDKALVKVHADFVEAAIKGAIAVVDKIIQPLNPMDVELQQVYVYNQIFFSFAMETPLSFKQESGLDATPTVSTTNCDFRNLKLLHRLDIPNLHLLNATLVDYKGRRVIAQSIIPGILNSDHSNCTQYGSIDEGKNIQKNKEFHQLMEKVCDFFQLDKEIEFLDEKDQVLTMAGGIEVKGILGSDKRMYLLDLLRLSPRDLNYTDQVNHQCCVLRPELIQGYYVAQTIEKLKNQDPLQIQQLQNMLQGNNEYKLKLNAAVYTNVRLNQSEKLEEQKIDLEKIAKFIIDYSLPTLIQDLKQSDLNKQSEFSSISDIFHVHGVNMRYLGKVTNQIEGVDFPSTRQTLERTILSKSLKHVFRQALRETPLLYSSQALAHLLNCVFSKFEDKQWLDQVDLAQQNQNTTNNENEKKKKKRKRKKKKGESSNTNSVVQKQKKLGSIIKIAKPQFLEVKPQQIWTQICQIALARYGYKFPDLYVDYTWFKFNFFKISCLRELCQSIGLKLVCQQFDIQDGNNNNQEQIRTYSTLPFHAKHIGSVEPVLKCIEVQSDDQRLNMELGQRFFAENKLQESLECFLTEAQIIMNLFGTVHQDLAQCFSRISSIYHKKAEFETSIQFQKQAVSIYIHIYGLDHIATANSLTNLAFYHFGMKKIKESFNYLLHSLYLYSVVGGEANQNVINEFANLSLLYSESGQHQNSLNCLFEALDRTNMLYKYAAQVYGRGKMSNSALTKIAGYNQAIALQLCKIGDIYRAVEFETKAINFFKSQKPNEQLKKN